MFSDKKDYHLAVIIVFYGIGSFWAIVSFFGCSGDIPSAGSLVSGAVRLSWDEVPGAISYNVYGSTSPGVTRLRGSKFHNVPNPFAITGLQPHKTYYFVVTAVTNSGESKESKQMSYTALANTMGTIQFGNIVDHSHPDSLSSDIQAKPTVKDLPSETNDVILAWEDVPDAISYNIYWSDKPGVNKHNGTKISNVKNPHKIEGLIIGKKYYFVVTAVSVSGESEASKELSITVGQ